MMSTHNMILLSWKNNKIMYSDTPRGASDKYPQYNYVFMENY